MINSNRTLASIVVCVVTLTLINSVSGQVFDEKFDYWPLETKIHGTIVFAESLNDVAVLKSAIRPPAEDAVIRIHTDRAMSAERFAQYQQLFEDREVEITTSATDAEHQAGIPKLLSECDVFCWETSGPLNDTGYQSVLVCRDALNQHIRDQGTLILVGPVASLAGRLRVNESADSSTRTGLNLVPDAIVHVSNGPSKESRTLLLKSLQNKPRTVGIDLPQQTAIVLSNRRLRVFGEGSATLLLPAGNHGVRRMQTVAQQTERRQRPGEYLIDWTEWRRDSIDRTLEIFPPKEPNTPHVPNGTLVIVGGGGMPAGLMQRIIDMAGGAEQAKMVYVPCSEQDQVSSEQRTVKAWEKMGVKSATHIHTKDRHKAHTDAEFQAPLKDATGIWFGGGRQWNFADSYYGTHTHQLMKEVLQRGGVIAGSSAGASVQARYLARATPIENFEIMAPGYERGGLGFISGVAIDQHFSQRRRQKDMTQLVNRYPQLLGIGIDEATAIIVQKSTAEVVGQGKVYFYDRTQPVVAGKSDYVSLPEGSSYNLATRTIIVDATKDDDDKSADVENETK